MTETTHKIIVLTDIHIRAPGARIIDLDPVARFQTVLRLALENHPDAAEIIFTGDLTHEGSALEYATLKDALPTNCPPIRWMLGNHDRRGPFLDAFPETPITAEGYVQQVIDLPGWRLVLLDTLDEDAPDLHSGWVSPDRLAWLEAALQNAGERRTIVFMHHPPYKVGFDGMDAIRLRNGPEVLEVLRAAQIELLVCGHIHRTISGVMGGVPSVIFKSPCHQMPFDLGPASIHSSVDEPGAYGLLLLGPDGVIAHTVEAL